MATPCSTWLSGEKAFKFSIEISFCYNDNYLFLTKLLDKSLLTGKLLQKIPKQIFFKLQFIFNFLNLFSLVRILLSGPTVSWMTTPSVSFQVTRYVARIYQTWKIQEDFLNVPFTPKQVLPYLKFFKTLTQSAVKILLRARQMENFEILL